MNNIGDDTIDFRRIQPGYWTLVVNGTDRPVIAVRQGRNWIVQAGSLSRTAVLESQHGTTRRLADAKSLMFYVWHAMDTARELARHEALEQEYRRLKDLARELKVTYPIFEDAAALPFRIAFIKARIEDEGFRVLHGTRI